MFAQIRLQRVEALGTELAFDEPVEFEKNCIETRRTNVKVATFRQIDLEDRHTHHDALEFSDGQIVRLASLIPGQRAVVLQLPCEMAEASASESQQSRVVETIRL